MNTDDAKRRTCQSCGMLCGRETEFHPHLFCRLKQENPRRNPWEDFRATAAMLGVDLPERAPLVRDLPLRSAVKP